MKRKSICIFLLLILMSRANNVYAVDQMRGISNEIIPSNSHYQLNTTYFGEQKEADLSLEVELEQGSSFIQPEGITNICSEIIFKIKCKEFSYQIDISSLIDEINNGVKLMNYNLDQIRVQIVDLKNSMILTKNDYIIESIVDNRIKIRFTNLVIEEGSSYRIAIYMPTTIGHEVIYGGRDTNSYLSKYVRNQRTDTVKAIVEACPKLEEVLDKNHQTIEMYSDKVLLKEYAISLSYMEIAKIY